MQAPSRSRSITIMATAIPIPACAPGDSDRGCDVMVLVTVTVLFAAVVIVAPKSEVWKRTWTEKAFNTPSEGIIEEITRLAEYFGNIVLHWPDVKLEAQ